MEPEVTGKVAKCNKRGRLCCSEWTRGAIYMDNLVTSYSGGWRMKTQLTAARLLNATA